MLLGYFVEKEKIKAETEKIKLENKITKEITYSQLKSDNKHKNIKNKLEILQKLVRLEEEIKNKENLTAGDQKKLETLEMIKGEFKGTFAVEEKEKPELIGKEKNQELKKQQKK